jgi:hypothetical protein
MKQVFGLVMDVRKNEKVIKSIVKRIEEREDFALRIHLEKNNAYVFGIKVVEGACFSGDGREMIVWTAGHFDEEERQISLWAVAQDDGEHEVRVSVEWAHNRALAAGVDMELAFIGSSEGCATKGRLKKRRLPTTEHRAKPHALEGRRVG